MFVVYESPMQVVADSPDVYVDAPGADFFPVPASWDETRVLSGAIGEHIAIARRRGDRYVGAMTNETPRTLEVPLDFSRLVRTAPRCGSMAIGRPTPPRGTRGRCRDVTPLRLSLSPGGGGAIRLTPVSATR